MFAFVSALLGYCQPCSQAALHAEAQKERVPKRRPARPARRCCPAACMRVHYTTMQLMRFTASLFPRCRPGSLSAQAAPSHTGTMWAL